MKRYIESERLVYRAVDFDQDEDFFTTLLTNPTAFALSHHSIPVPQSRSDARHYMKKMVEEQLLGVVICLKPASASQQKGKRSDELLIPIGEIRLTRNASNRAQHRDTMISLGIIEEYQGRGYGGEAILWATDWAFAKAGINRVEIRAYEFNERARHLYQKLGFTQEGILREAVWHEGRFWDAYIFSLLARERQAGRKQVSS
jgi:RimJ/RimL family protein N-acetyltransferase